MPTHVVRIDRAYRLGSQTVLVDVGCMLSHVLRVEKHGLIDLIHLAFKKVSLFEFRVEVRKSLF